jgi:thymidylate synthase
MQIEGIVEIARGAGLAEAWERAVVLTWERGAEFVHEDTGDTYRGRPMVIELPEALGEPRYHRMIMALPSDIESYIQEVVAGSKDHLIDLSDPNKWHYTYHERLTHYAVPSGELINQIEALLEHLARKPNSRRAQAISWKPWMDPEERDPPCLQRVWCIVQDGRLNMHTHWRSREAILASYMNILALTTWQGMFAERLGVGTGCYLDFSDSFHVYQRDYPRAQMLVEKFRTAPPEARFMSEELYRSLL